MKNDHGQNEFLHEGLSEWDPALDRREFLKLSSAAIALAGLSACVKPPSEKIFSYVSQPEDVIPGEPTFFATHHILGGYASGMIVESHEGRPTRIDGNPDHPANFGAASAIQQASVLSLYDPDRLRSVFNRKGASTIDAFFMDWKARADSLRLNQGKGLAILIEDHGSDLIHAQRLKLETVYPKAVWTEYNALSNPVKAKASLAVFGESLRTLYHFKDAKLVISIDSDFLSHPLWPLAYARDFAQNPSVALFSIQTAASLTGEKARAKLSVKPSRLIEVFRLIARRLSTPGAPEISTLANEQQFIDQVVSRIRENPSEVVFVAGDHLPEEFHELAFRLNAKLGGKALSFVKANAPLENQGLSGLSDLTAKINAGLIDTLVIVGGNPVYASPAKLNLKHALEKIRFKVQLTLSENETSQGMDWVIPEAHFLECFGDGRAMDGTLSFSQPMIAPLYEGLSSTQLLDGLLHFKCRSGRDILNEHYQTVWGDSAQEKLTRAFCQGFVAGSSLPKIKPTVRHFTASQVSGPVVTDRFELCFREDRRLFDGRYANHPWLQEFPDPLTRLTWGNAILLHPDEMKKRGFATEAVLKIELNEYSLEIPAFPDPLQARDSATLHFGYGRQICGSVGKNVGANVFQVWQGEFFTADAKITATGKTGELACTQSHHSMEGRDLIRTVGEGEKASRQEQPTSLYDADPIPDAKEAWAMTIDLDRCTGCGACVVACQSENNIPTVGIQGVRLGREMHWIRVDRYFTDASEARAEFQPIPCMHCEKAPCEPVCPTGATVHGGGGLNQMVYNRCVGTRYCSNNCPYKVRRFNFLTYNDKTSKLAARSRNPNVSVRTRGVMEKCTYCVQRISAARIKSERQQTILQDGDVKTACQVTCPSQAIQFGNLRDENAIVSRQRKLSRNYGLLEELGTRPRTTYLAKLRKKDA